MPLASNKWYMLQYELAYDPNISNMLYNNIQFSWYLNYYNIQKIRLGGKMEGSIVQTFIGQSSTNGSNGFASTLGANATNLLKTIGTGVIAGIGQGFLDRNTIDNSGNPYTPNNKLGLNNSVFSSLVSGIAGAAKGAFGGIPGAVVGFLSGILGGSSASVPLNFQLETKIELQGSMESCGSFPSMPISFWVPGTMNINAATIGQIPLYTNTLGVVNFIGKPSINTHFSYNQYEVEDPYDGRYCSMTDYFLIVDLTRDYSSHLIFNPSVLEIANIEVVAQDLVYQYQDEVHCIMPQYYWYETHEASASSTPDIIGNSKLGVRFTIKVTPKNGAPHSIIVKTFELAENRN